MAFQALVIQGNVGQVHDSKYTSDGKHILGFSIAYSEGKDKPTTWFNCIAFGKTADLVKEYVQKGDPLIVEGKIICEKYQDKTTGQEREAWKVKVNNIGLLGGKREQTKHHEEKSNGYQKQELPDTFDNDIPF